jgi:hypothetical protein
VSETGTYSPVLPSATSVAVEAAQEVFIEGQEEEHARHASDAA